MCSRRGPGLALSRRFPDAREGRPDVVDGGPRLGLGRPTRVGPAHELVEVYADSAERLPGRRIRQRDDGAAERPPPKELRDRDPGLGGGLSDPVPLDRRDLEPDLDLRPLFRLPLRPPWAPPSASRRGLLGRSGSPSGGGRTRLARPLCGLRHRGGPVRFFCRRKPHLPKIAHCCLRPQTKGTSSGRSTPGPLAGVGSERRVCRHPDHDASNRRKTGRSAPTFSATGRSGRWPRDDPSGR